MSYKEMIIKAGYVAWYRLNHPNGIPFVEDGDTVQIWHNVSNSQFGKCVYAYRPYPLPIHIPVMPIAWLQEPQE